MLQQTLIFFIPACFALNMALGPSNVLSITIGAQHGVKTAVLAATGRLIAFAIMIAISAVGLGALLTASEMAFSIVKWAGAVYLVWLGVRLVMSKGEAATQENANDSGHTIRDFFRQEFLVAIGNPKAILIFTAFFPQFVVPESYWQCFALFGCIFLAFEVVAISLYSFLGFRLKKIARNAGTLRYINRVSGSIMIFFGLGLAAMRRPTP